MTKRFNQDPEILKVLVLVVYLNRKTQSKAVFVLTSAWIIYGLVLFLHLRKTYASNIHKQQRVPLLQHYAE